MKRLLRIIFPFIPGISSILALIVLWLARPIGRSVNIFFHRNPGGVYYLVEFEPCIIGFGVSNATSSYADPNQSPSLINWGRIHAATGGMSPPPFSYWPHDAMDVSGNSEEVMYRHWLVPTWFVAGLLILPAAIQLILLIARKRRFKPGLCPICGYDLRATPTRCPECGSSQSDH
jgi:hypothetical protein